MKSMRIVVFSDTHGQRSAAAKVFDRNQNADAFIFLGDGEREFEYAKGLYPQKTALMVSGNCDYNSLYPSTDIFMAGDTKILFSHGHIHDVKYSTERMYNLALSNNSKIVLFGHTHCRYYEYRDGIYLLNPGSASCPRDFKRPSYAIIDVTDKGIMCNHVDL